IQCNHKWKGRAVATSEQDCNIAFPYRVTRVLVAVQQAVEFCEFAALSFPSHPDAFRGVPLPVSMQDDKRLAAFLTITLIQRANAGAELVRQRLVCRLMLCWCIGEVRQQREREVW